MERLKKKYVQARARYRDWKQRLVYKTAEEDPLAKELGTGWKGLGYHRTIGGFWYYVWMLIPEGLFGLALVPLLQYTEFRFPEVSGFTFASVGIFAAMYAILDLDLKAAIDRFVPANIVKNPLRAMQYVSFFVKYQMWSGLFQIASVAILVQFLIVPHTEFAYLAFYLLFESVKQYPATLGLFSGLLGSFQRFNKKTNITILRASFIEPLTKIGGGLLGLYWGMNDPAIGELLGLTLGWAIGGYVDDFFTFTAGTYLLSKVLDEYGIRIRDIYIMKVPREVWGSALGYSARLLPKTIFNSILGLTGFLITVENLPGYLTLVGLTKKAEDLAGFMVKFSDDVLQDSQPVLSESYNNGKMNLTRYYIASGMKYWSFFFLLFGSFLIIALPVILTIAFEGGFLPRTWSLVAIMAPFYVYTRVLDPFKQVGEKMINVSNHPEINAVVDIASTLMNLFFTWYFLVVLDMGWLGLILRGFPAQVMVVIVRLIFTHVKILPLPGSWWKDVAWQVFAAPFLAGTVLIGFMLLIFYGLWPAVSANLEGGMLLVAAAPILILVLIGGLFIYMPIYAWLGGWDENTLRDFKKSLPLSGPTIVLTYPLYKISTKFHAKSPFKRLSHMKVGDVALGELLELGRERAKPKDE